MEKLNLANVTLCAATSVNLAATVAALRACREQIDFGECLLLTDAECVTGAEGLRIVPIAPLESARDYSDFIIRRLSDHIRTEHCLIVQWDGFVVDAGRWDPRFLEYDYIGAPWPQFNDGHAVGNGGFSLRSRALLAACQDEAFQFRHPEDIAICRDNRSMLEARHGIRFADADLAGRFAFERTASRTPAFGFHGVFNLIPVCGTERFWEVYRSLDDPRTVFVDFATIWRQLGGGRSAFKRRYRLARDRLSSLFRG